MIGFFNSQNRRQSLPSSFRVSESALSVLWLASFCCFISASQNPLTTEICIQALNYDDVSDMRYLESVMRDDISENDFTVDTSSRESSIIAAYKDWQARASEGDMIHRNNEIRTLCLSKLNGEVPTALSTRRDVAHGSQRTLQIFGTTASEAPSSSPSAVVVATSTSVPNDGETSPTGEPDSRASDTLSPSEEVSNDNSMISTDEESCPSLLSNSDINLDGNIDKEEYVAFLEELEPTFQIDASFDLLPFSFQDSYLNFANGTDYIEISDNVTDAVAQDVVLSTICSETISIIMDMESALSNAPTFSPGSSNSPTVSLEHCLKELEIADSNRDELLTENEYRKFVNGLSRSEFDELPQLLQDTFSNLEQGGEIDVAGAVAGENPSSAQMTRLVRVCLDTSMAIQAVLNGVQDIPVGDIQALTVFSSFVIANDEGVTTEELRRTESNPLRNALNKAFVRLATFVDQQVQTSSTNVQLRGRTRRLSVTFDARSARIYEISETGCTGVGDPFLCHLVFGEFNVYVVNENSDEIYDGYITATSDAINHGELQAFFEEEDPTSGLIIIGTHSSLFPPTEQSPLPVPTPGPTPAPTPAPITPGTSAPTLSQIDEGGSSSKSPIALILIVCVGGLLICAGACLLLGSTRKDSNRRMNEEEDKFHDEGVSAPAPTMDDIIEANSATNSEYGSREFEIEPDERVSAPPPTMEEIMEAQGSEHEEPEGQDGLDFAYEDEDKDSVGEGVFT